MDKVFVLIRTKVQFYSSFLSKDCYNYFYEALKSVLYQTYPNITIVILQDNCLCTYSKPQQKSLPQFCKNVVNDAIKDGYETKNKDILFYSSNSKGAAHSLCNIRQIVMNLSQNDNDITIMLDDDDVFTNSQVVENIVTSMNHDNAQICISKFNIIGAKNLNIINKGGGNHNKLVSEMSQNKEPFGIGSECFADSLGWTKTYRVGVLREYYDDLLRYFKSYRKLQNFFIKHDAFEDFPEIINLCRNNVTVVWLNEYTHSYRKHQHSITAKTRKDDFKIKRPIYLALLIGLYDLIKDKLNGQSNTIIVRYCIIKMLTIENILAKFKIQRYGYFRRWLTRLENGAFLRISLSVFRNENVLRPFMEMVKEYPDAKDINLNKSNLSIVEELCKKEAVKGFVDVVGCMQEKSYRFQAKRFSRKYEIMGGLTVLLIGILLFIFILFINDPEHEKVPKLMSAGGIALIGWVFTLYSKFKKERENEEKLTNMFSDAVSELQRHIMANFKVLLEIHHSLTDEKIKPSKIHFSNLKVSSHSFFMSDEMDKYIVIDEFKELSHLRVHIRNINSSATHMEEYAGSESYDPNIMLNLVDWQLAQHLGYLIGLMYFNENKIFHFPNKEQIEIFVKNRDVFESISNEIPKDYTGKKTVQKIYAEYLYDRMNRRNILNMN